MIARRAVPRALSQLDQYSRYADPEMARDRRAARHGFTGIGVTITQDDGRVRINQVYDRSPAAKAGLKAGDIIVAVDGTVIEDGDIRAVARRVRGLSGTLVTLTLRRREATLDIAIRRAPVVPQTIALSREGGFFNHQISGFNEHTSRDLVRALDRGGADGRLDGVILDYAKIAAGSSTRRSRSRTCSFPSTLLATHGRHPRADQSFRPSARDRLVDVPMVALVDRGSASAAEIVAGALARQRPRPGGRHPHLWQRLGANRPQSAQWRRNDGDLGAYVRAVRLRAVALRVYPSVCVGDISGRKQSHRRPGHRRLGHPPSQPPSPGHQDERGRPGRAWTRCAPARRIRKRPPPAITTRWREPSSAIPRSTPRCAAKPPPPSPTPAPRSGSRFGSRDAIALTAGAR